MLFAYVHIAVEFGEMENNVKKRKIITMNNLNKLVLCTILFGFCNAHAAPIVLDFEGLDNLEVIDGFYNGGTSANGNIGPNLGVAFSGNTLAIIDADAGGSGNIGGEPSPDTIMFFPTGASAIMNVAAGFDTGFSFFYSAINNPGSVSVFDRLEGTGNLLASLNIPITISDGGDPTGQFSPFFAIGVGFDGVAKSVSFAGVQNQIGFDNITFGSVTPGGPNTVPEPASIALIGLGLAGLAVMRRKKVA